MLTSDSSGKRGAANRPAQPSDGHFLLLLAAIFVGRGGLHAQAADPPNLAAANQRLVLAEGAEQSRALADQQRYLLVRQALALHEKEQRQATDDLARLAVAKERIEHLRNTQAWALGNTFEAGRRGILAEPRKVSETLARWRNAREQSLRAYLEFPAQSRGAIKNARALNFFFDLCADVAMSHELWRSQLQDERRRMDARIRQLKEHPPGGEPPREDARKELAALEKERAETEARLSILSTLSGKPLLDREQVGQLRFRKGLAGPALVISRDDVMPLDLALCLGHGCGLRRRTQRHGKRQGGGLGRIARQQRRLAHDSSQPDVRRRRPAEHVRGCEAAPARRIHGRWRSRPAIPRCQAFHSGSPLQRVPPGGRAAVGRRDADRII